MDLLPSKVSDILTRPLSFPDRDKQELFSQNTEDLRERLGQSGTIVYLPNCDRLTFSKARTLCEHAIRECHGSIAGS